MIDVNVIGIGKKRINALLDFTESLAEYFPDARGWTVERSEPEGGFSSLDTITFIAGERRIEVRLSKVCVMEVDGKTFYFGVKDEQAILYFLSRGGMDHLDEFGEVNRMPGIFDVVNRKAVVR